MEKAKLIEELNKLIQSDIDAYYANKKALENVENDHIRTQLSQLQSGHEKHIEDLSSIVRQLEGNPPIHQDLKGYAIEGAVAVGGIIDEKTVLQAVQYAEKLTYSSYEGIISLNTEIPVNIRYLVERYLAEQQNYLQSMDQLLKAA